MAILNNDNGSLTMTDSPEENVSRAELLRMASEVVSSYVCENPIQASQIPDLIQTVYASLSSLAEGGASQPAEVLKPAVPVRRSITPDFIVCLEDGKKLKMLKRHLRTTYGLSPDEYRSKWGLGADYPMVAPNYAAQRSAFAKQIGLGRKGGRKKS